MIGVKVFEIFVMVFALVSLATHHLYLTVGCVFLMGVHSAIFGPSKYGSLPELLPEKKLSWGNGVLELGTFLAIITGGAIGGLLFKTFEGRQQLSAAVFISLALIGFITSLGITRIPAANPAKKFRANFLGDLFQQIKRETRIGRNQLFLIARNRRQHRQARDAKQNTCSKFDVHDV